MEVYEALSIEIIVFDQKDVIITSSSTTSGGPKPGDNIQLPIGP